MKKVDLKTQSRTTKKKQNQKLYTFIDEHAGQNYMPPQLKHKTTVSK